MTASPIGPPSDFLALWFLGDPALPVPVGTLAQLHTGTRGVSLRYGDVWLRTGFALSEDLPLIDIEHLPRERGAAVGAVDDARPDQWGERIIRFVERPPRLAPIDFLFHAGDDRFGALGVSTSAERYEPHQRGPLPLLGDADRVHEMVRRVIAGEPVPEAERRLVAPGGARPKALIDMDGASWVLKFDEEPGAAEPLVEHATMTLAARAGIRVAETRPVALARGQWAVAVRRFDRAPGGRRLHALSARTALRAAGVPMAYPELAQLLRRRGPAEGGVARTQMRELFRRLVFNILTDNTDDHEQNHVLLVDGSTGHYELSPAFDMLPTGQSLGYQSMEVGERGAESSVDNALSIAAAYGLKPLEAQAEARAVAAVVDGWQAHFRAAGVPAQALEGCAAAVDRPALVDQRRALLASLR